MPIPPGCTKSATRMVFLPAVSNLIKGRDSGESGRPASLAHPGGGAGSVSSACRPAWHCDRMWLPPSATAIRSRIGGGPPRKAAAATTAS